MSKKYECFERLKDLIENVVLIDLEDQIDEIFGVIAKEKDSKSKYEDELNELHEMRSEFKLILEDIENKELEIDECKELYDEILSMISEEE